MEPIHKPPQKLVFGKAKAPAIGLSKMGQYCNMDPFLIDQSRGFRKAENPIYEVVYV